MDPNFHITTPRLYISYLQPDDDSHCDFLVQLWNSPEFIAACGKTRVRTREDARKEIGGRFIEDHNRNGYGMYLVSLRPARSEGNTTTTAAEGASFPQLLRTCTHIGTVSLMRGKPPNALPAPDLGFAVLPGETRKGYAKEAAQALVEYAEDKLGVRHVLGLFDPANEASSGVFRSLGFRDCGVKNLGAFGGLPVAIWVRGEMGADFSVGDLK